MSPRQEHGAGSGSPREGWETLPLLSPYMKARVESIESFLIISNLVMVAGGSEENWQDRANLKR